MLLLIIFLTGIFTVLGAALLAALADLRGLKIPNIYSLIIIAAFGVSYGLLWAFGREDVFSPLLSHFLSALIVFLVTLIMFALKGIGAGDSKLATACALWTGMNGLFVFLFYMTLSGGLLGLSALVLRKTRPFKAPAEGSWVAQVQVGQSKVPYGVAILCGILASFIKLGYLGSEVLSSFLLS
jgi:prepilin peptidase CpaA